MTSIVLLKPVEAYGEPVKELTFREPNAKDFRACGVPFEIVAGAEENSSTRLHFDAPAVLNLIARLTNIPPSAVDSLCLADFMECQATIMGFFGGRGVGPNILDRYYDVAWQWKGDGDRILGLTIEELKIEEAQTVRLLRLEHERQRRSVRSG